MGQIHPSLQEKMPNLFELFRKYKLKNVYFFGSAITDNFGEKSDLDILINFKPEINDPLEKGKLMWDLQFAIEDELHRSVDIFQESTPKNPFFKKELNQTKLLVYEQYSSSSNT